MRRSSASWCVAARRRARRRLRPPPHTHATLPLAQGEDLFAKVKAAKVLVVGAGGIGCELLKNLVLTGFANIEVRPRAVRA
jgi:hypothetical protein